MTYEFCNSLILEKFPANINKTFLQMVPDFYRLDQYYMQTRYPDMLGGTVAPSDFFKKEEAEDGMKLAKKTLETSERVVNKIFSLGENASPSIREKRNVNPNNMGGTERGHNE